MELLVFDLVVFTGLKTYPLRFKQSKSMALPEAA